AVRRLLRVARFLLWEERWANPERISNYTLTDFTRLHASDIAWGDRAAKELRRLSVGCDPQLEEPIHTALGRFLAARDQLNRIFGGVVAKDWAIEAHRKWASEAV